MGQFSLYSYFLVTVHAMATFNSEWKKNGGIKKHVRNDLSGFSDWAWLETLGEMGKSKLTLDSLSDSGHYQY